MLYNQKHYKEVFTNQNDLEQIERSTQEPSLLELVDVINV